MFEFVTSNKSGLSSENPLKHFAVSAVALPKRT